MVSRLMTYRRDRQSPPLTASVSSGILLSVGTLFRSPNTSKPGSEPIQGIHDAAWFCSTGGAEERRFRQGGEALERVIPGPDEHDVGASGGVWSDRSKGRARFRDLARRVAPPRPASDRTDRTRPTQAAP